MKRARKTLSRPMWPESRPKCAVDSRAPDRASEDRALQEIIRIVCDEQSAKLLALEAGFPSQRLPAFTTSVAYWTTTAREARYGLLRDGVRAIIRAAAALYPNNGVFRAFVDSERGSPEVRPKTPHEELHEEVTAALLAHVSGHMSITSLSVPGACWLMRALRHQPLTPSAGAHLFHLDARERLQ